MTAGRMDNPGSLIYKRTDMHKEKWNARYREKVPDELGDANSQLKTASASLKPGRAIDLAAGDGRNAIFLAEQGWEVTAVDFSETGIERGKKIAQKRGVFIQWIVKDLTEYLPPADSFDLVCLMYLHIPRSELSTVLQRAAAALKPGGTLLVVGHDRSNIDKGVGGPQKPETLYDPGDIVSLLPGLTVEYAESERRPPDHGDFPAGTVQIDCVVRATCPL